MYPNLKFQIFRRGSHQYELARAVGIDETVLSKIIRGYREPTSQQRRQIAGYLEVDENWLFERFEPNAPQAAPAHAPLILEKKPSTEGSV